MRSLIPTLLSRLAVGTLIVATGLTAARGADTLVLQRTIPLPGVSGRIDHCAYDRFGQRLFVAALGNNSVEVVDVANGRVLGSLPGFNEPQGIAYVRELNRLFVANGGDGSVCIMDGSSFSTRTILQLGSDADNVRYDRTARQIAVGYGEGGLALIEPGTGKIETQVELVAHPESFQLEQKGPRIFINVPDAQHIAVVDRTTRRVLSRWRVSTGGNFAMALDEDGHRLFVGCRSPARLLVLSSTDGKELGRADLHGDCDDVFFDPARHRLYATCGAGYVDVFSVGNGANVKRTDGVITVPGARTSYFDGQRLYVAVPQRDTPAEIRIYEAR
jgi:DNA-binding beta-propeller fold protein YncE